MTRAPDPERSRLGWRCRRGRREWDLLLSDWLGRHYEAATPAQRARFEQVLGLSDPVLEGYLLTAGHPLPVDLPEPPRGCPAEPSTSGLTLTTNTTT
jgi:antitoxin CptB